ncbi:MAG: 6,7-dimethyl-8-ribityllumazine synthase [Pirellulaceae bacterium]|nr:6,7-dimethyl-8-ribityllumazine synthase [Pirellulaceae bacterium]
MDNRYAIIVSRYNESITEKLLHGALDTLQQHGVTSDKVEVIRVPGAWELPLAAKWLARSSKKFQGLIAIGVVIKGDTTHDQHINRFVSLALGQVSLDFEIPVALGLLTCDTLQQAVDRAGGKVGNKGEEAALAALEMVKLRVQSGI